MALTKVSYSMIQGQYVNALDYGADPTGATDCAIAVQAAVTAAAGRPVYFPAGTYKIGTTIDCSPLTYDVSNFGAPAKIIGDGQLKTYFDNRVNGPLFSLVTISTSVLFKGALGGRFEGFTINSGATTTNGVGIYMTTAYQPTIQNVNIIGMSLHGIHIPCFLGDNDASNMVLLDHIRIENCAGWGIKANGDSGFNETSYIYMQQVFIQNCGTTDGNYQPSSGGMNWKGQILTMQQCAFTINQNCALFIPGQSGAANTVDIQDTTFENNKVRGIFCRGVSVFKGRNVQIYNNQTYTATNGCEFEANSFTIENVELDGIYIRATSANNPYTAFKISGANVNLNTCRVTDVTFNNFDYAGQTRFDGWQFDPIPNNGILLVASSTEVYLKPNTFIGTGNKVPLRLQGPNNQSGVGVASTSGQWIANELPSGGLSLNVTSIVANTRYWVYLYDNDGVPTLEASSSVSFVTDSTSGYAVKSGDATRYFVGSIIGGATNGTVATTATGWLNPQTIPGTQVGVPSYLWADSTNRLRIETTLPTSDTDGTVVGTQV
jgi:hypothetical protein